MQDAKPWKSSQRILFQHNPILQLAGIVNNDNKRTNAATASISQHPTVNACVAMALKGNSLPEVSACSLLLFKPKLSC